MGVGTALIAGGMGAFGAYSSYEASRARNEQAERAKANAERRYALESGVAKNQMEEQAQMATSEMTDVTRKFLVAKSRAKAVQAESGVSGNIVQRMDAIRKTKESETKGKISKQIDTNVINIAQGMLAKKIDTEALIQEAESKKVNVFTNTLKGGLQGISQGYQLGNQLSGIDFGSSKNTYSQNSLSSNEYISVLGIK